MATFLIQGFYLVSRAFLGLIILLLWRFGLILLGF